LQVFGCRVMIACGKRDPGQQDRALCGREPGGQLGGGAQVAEGQAEQCFGFVGAGQQR